MATQLCRKCRQAHPGGEQYGEVSVPRLHVQMDFYSSVTEFRAKVDDLNASAALNEHASRCFHGEPSDCYPVFAMLYMQ